MIKIAGESLQLHPPPEHPKLPALSIPLLSLHTCTCGAVVKAYALTEGRLDRVERYDPKEEFKWSAVAGGLVFLRIRHGKEKTHCGESITAFTAEEAARLVAEAIWRGGQNWDEPPPIAGDVDPDSFRDVKGLTVLIDHFDRRPPIYLVHPPTVIRYFCSTPDYARYNEWKAAARETFDRFVQWLELRTTLSFELRAVEHLPRRKHPALVAAAVPLPVVELPSAPSRPPCRGPVQLSLFSL